MEEAKKFSNVKEKERRELNEAGKRGDLFCASLLKYLVRVKGYDCTSILNPSDKNKFAISDRASSNFLTLCRICRELEALAPEQRRLWIALLVRDATFTE